MTRSAAYPAHPVMSIFSGERTFRFGAPSNSIFFNDIRLLEIHHAHAKPTVRQVTQRELQNPKIEIVYLSLLNSFIRIEFPTIRRFRKSGNFRLIR